MHRNRKIKAVFFGLAAVALGIIFSSTHFAQAAFLDRATENFALLSGFKPDAKVSYRIFSQNEMQSYAFDTSIDEQGFLNIPVPEGIEKFGSHVVYDMSISQGDEPLQVLFRLNTQKGTVSVEGKGAEAFSEIEIDTGIQKIKTGSDWAGLFEESGINNAFSKEEEKAFQVAFYSRNIASDAIPENHPAIIRVQWAPGGGGPGNGGVNTYNPTVCGNPLHSYCVAARMNQQIQNVVDNYVHAMQLMAEQMSAVAMQQTAMVGMFLDAKNQMETQRLHQQLKARAVKDYHPSEQMCRVGSYVRSLPAVEHKASYDHFALNDILTENYTNQETGVSGSNVEGDYESRLNQFKDTYCDVRDHDGGLGWFCDHDRLYPTPARGATDPLRVNRDVDFQRTIDANYTLDIDFTNPGMTEEEEDVIALAKNLYWPIPFKSPTEELIEKNSKYYMRARRLMAFNNLAHNSYSKLVSLKARAPDPVNPVQPGWLYMKTMLREFGLSDPDIEELVGENPSYDAQMEILSKKMFQNPNFYTNLYDKPVNVDRINASLDAIQLMQARDHYNAALRREMLMSAMVEETLIGKAEKIHATLIDSK